MPVLHKPCLHPDGLAMSRTVLKIGLEKYFPWLTVIMKNLDSGRINESKVVSLYVFASWVARKPAEDEPRITAIGGRTCIWNNRNVWGLASSSSSASYSRHEAGSGRI